MKTLKKATKMILLLSALLSVFSLPAMAAEESSAVHDRGGTKMASAHLFLNSFAALGEGHVESVLRGLKIISVTEEARSGKWENMSGLLTEFSKSGIKAAAVWFVRPDGTYYTLEKGLTDLNLRERDYFPRLMAGEDISGDLVISKSTGKRTVIVAVPIQKNRKVIGALVTSLSVEDISRMIDEKMGLPKNMFFYALDHQDRTSLHRVSAFLLSYPSDMGSKSLTKTVGEMLANPEGTVTYDFYGERSVIYKKLPLTGWVYAIGIVTGRSDQQDVELPPILSELEKKITAELNKMDQDVAKLAKNLSEKDLKTDGTVKMLGDLCRSYPYAVDCSVVDRNGIMVLVEPEKYAVFAGSNISAQEQVIRLKESKKPVMSNVIKTVEGIDAVDLEHPVLSSRGELSGSVSLLFRPESLFSHIIPPVLQGMPVEAFVMQTDGRILYDADKEEIGRMLFDDPMYKPFSQLTALGTIISREKTGTGSYEFRREGTEKVVKKDAHWTAIGLHGTEWRLVIMHVRAGNELSSRKDVVKTGNASYVDALRTLANNTEMKKALSGKDIEKIKNIFKDFYSEHEGLYSIQWLDSQGTNRYGYPEESSLINFDMKTLKTPSSKPMLQALSDKKERSFDAPLMEGEKGFFFMVPVYGEMDYPGMIYTIMLKD